jgi:hypothetical protein
VGAADCPAYRGTCFALSERFPLKDYGNATPNFTAIIAFNGDDDYPQDEPSPGSGSLGGGMIDHRRNVAVFISDGSGANEIDIHEVDLSDGTVRNATVTTDATWTQMCAEDYTSMVAFSDGRTFVGLWQASGGVVVELDIENLEIVMEYDVGSGVWARPKTLIAVERLDFPLGSQRFVVVDHGQSGSNMWYRMINIDTHAVSDEMIWVTGTLDHHVSNQFMVDGFEGPAGELYASFQPQGPLSAGTRTDICRGSLVWITGYGLAQSPGFPEVIWEDYYIPADEITTGRWLTFLPGDDALLVWNTGTASAGGPDGKGLARYDITEWPPTLTHSRFDGDDPIEFDGNDTHWAWEAFSSQNALSGQIAWNHGVEPAGSTYRINTSDLSDVPGYPIANTVWPTGWSNHQTTLFDPTYNSVIFSQGTGNDFMRLFLDRADGDVVGLDEVVGDLCQRGGLAVADYNVTDLAIGVDAKNQVRGFRVTRRTTVRSAIETLTKGYFFDGVESDWVLKFLRREATTRDTGETIPEDDLGVGINKPGDTFVELERIQDEEIPVWFDIRYINPNIDYQEDVAITHRILSPIMHVAAQSQQSADLPIVFNETEAKRIAERWLYTAWTERVGVKFSVLPKWLLLDPTDVFDVVANSYTHKVRLLGSKIGESFDMECDAVEVDLESYIETDSAGSTTDYTPQEISVITGSYIIVLDIPLLEDSHSSGGTMIPIYVTVRSATSSGWPGGLALKSSDRIGWGQIGSFTSESAYGRTTETLGDWTSQGIDDTNTVQVRLAHDGLSLSSITESEMYDGGNPAMLGSELLQFQNATDLGDNLWELDTFLRGRRGSEWANSTHTTAGERFVFLSAGSIRLHRAPLDDLYTIRYYRGISLGGSLTTGHTVSLDCQGVALMPYAPSNVGAVRDDTGNRLLVYWTRRSRIGGEIDWSAIVEVPIGEETETYELDLLYKVSGEVYATYSTTGSGSRQTSTSVTFSIPAAGMMGMVSTGIDESLYVEGKLVRVSGADVAQNNGTFLIDTVAAAQLDVENADAVADTDTADTKIIDEIGEQIVIPEADLQAAGYTDIDDDIDVVVYQMSAVVGRGYPTSATV